MKCISLWLLLILTRGYDAYSQESEYLLSMRAQRMIANSSINKQNNLQNELAILKQKMASLPLTREANVQFKVQVDNFLKKAANERTASDLNTTLASTFLEGVQSVYKLSSFVSKIGVKAPWVVAIAKTGDLVNAGVQAIPDPLKQSLAKNWGPATLAQEADKVFDKQVQEALSLVDARATAQQKASLVTDIKNVYFKSEAEKKFNDGKASVSGSSMTLDQAIQTIKDIDTKVEDNLTAQADLYARIMATQERSYITAVETKKEITRLKSDIKQLSQDVRKTGQTVQEIKLKQDQLYDLTQQFAIKTDLAFKATSRQLSDIDSKLTDLSDPVLQAILKDNVGIGDKIARLERFKSDADKGLETIYGAATPETKQKIEKEISSYKNEQERLIVEHYVQIADRAIAYGELGLAAMEKYNIGSEQDRKFIKNMIFAVQIGAAIAKAKTGDPTALLQIGLGLFSKPKPSPEMQMLQRIDQRLDAIETTIFQGFEETHKQIEATHKDLAERIYFVSEQLVDIRQQVANDHLETMTTLVDIQNKLDFLVRQNILIDAKLTKLLSTETDGCFEPYNTFVSFVQRDPNYIKATSQPDYLNSFISGQKCEPCLDGLLRLLNKDFLGDGSGAFDYIVYRDDLSQYVDNTQSLLIQPQLYQKLLELWELRFKNNTVAKQKDLATVAMLFPTINASNQITSYQNFLTANPSPTLAFTETYKQRPYINYKKVIQLANYLYEFYPMLELYNGDDKSGKLYTTFNDLRQNSSFATFRVKLLQDGLKKTLTLIERSMAHESLMSGNMLFDTLQTILRTKHHPQTASLFNILRSNPIIAQNFASYLVSTTIKTNERFDQYLKKFDNQENHFVSMNELIDNSDAAYFFLKSNASGLSLGIQKQYISKNASSQDQLEEDWIELPLIQDLKTTVDTVTGVATAKELYVVDRLVTTNAFDALLDSREKIVSLLAERQLMSRVEATDMSDNLSTTKINYILFGSQLLDSLYSQKEPLCETVQVSIGGPTTLCGGQPIVLTAIPTNSILGYSYQWKVGNTIIGTNISSLTVLAGGVYSLTATNACSSTATSVTVTEAPNPSVRITGDLSACTNQSTVLTANATGGTGAYIYQWKQGNATVGSNVPSLTVTGGNNYTLTVIDAKGCAVTASVSVSTVACATPTVSLPGGATATASLTLTANTGLTGGNDAGVTYQWLLNGNPIAGATSSTYTASSSGSYAVSVTLSGRTTVSPAVMLTINLILAVEPVGISDYQIVVYPNPTTGECQVRVEVDTKQTVRFHLINALGTSVRQWNMQATPKMQPIQVPLPDADGLYFLRVETSQGTIVKKVLRQIN